MCNNDCLTLHTITVLDIRLPKSLPMRKQRKYTKNLKKHRIDIIWNDAPLAHIHTLNSNQQTPKASDVQTKYNLNQEQGAVNVLIVWREPFEKECIFQFYSFKNCYAIYLHPLSNNKFHICASILSPHIRPHRVWNRIQIERIYHEQNLHFQMGLYLSDAGQKEWKSFDAQFSRNLKFRFFV